MHDGSKFSRLSKCREQMRFQARQHQGNPGSSAMVTQCYHRLPTSLTSGAPKDRMFPNTPEMSQMVFSRLQKPVWLIWNCPKNYLSVRVSQGNFGRHESFRWLFRLIRKCSLHLWVQSKVRGNEVALLSLENYRGPFVFIPKDLGDLFLTIIAIRKKLKKSAKD